MLTSLTSDIWGDAQTRKDSLIQLPALGDGGGRLIPAQMTKPERRFMDFLLANVTREQVEKAVEYATSDRG